jgi:antitoxin VapB
VEERLQRVRQESRKEALARTLLAIGEDCARRMKELWRSIDHGELLYDERGLPR